MDEEEEMLEAAILVQIMGPSNAKPPVQLHMHQSYDFLHQCMRGVVLPAAPPAKVLSNNALFIFI
jgi:hypothetical protein